MSTSNTSIHRLLRPKTIAVIGGSWAEAVITQCDKIGFEGEIWPVNPKKEEMGGRRCFPDIKSLPAAPDAAFIAVRREVAADAVGQLNRMGAGGAVCFASGFAETGEPVGQQLQADLVAAIGDLALVGPNCYGLLNYLDRVTLWPDEHGGQPIEKGVAVVTQSGNIAISISMQRRNLPLAYLISSGNQAGITTPEYISALLDDDRVNAIGLHLEGIQDLSAFAQSALKALEKRVPLVVLKTGASDIGSSIALTHTSSLSGSDQLFDAYFKRYGIVRVHTIPELLETLKFLAIIGPLPSKNIATISSSGGEATLSADMGERLGLNFLPISPQQKSALRAVLGERVDINNPLDYHTYIWGDVDKQYETFKGMLLGEQAVTMKLLDFPRPDICDPTTWVNTAIAFQWAANDLEKKGVLLATMHENQPDFVAKEMLAHGIAPMLGMHEAFVAARGAAELFAAQAAHAAEPHRLPNLGKPFRPISDTLVTLNEFKSKKLLERYGIPIPQLTVATNKNCVEKGLEIGYPVVVKTLSDQIVHKSDVGGVALNLATDEAVEAAIAKMAQLSDHFLIEKMAPKPIVEMILGLTRDPQFGLALVVGAGGLLVELYRDSRTLLLPFSRAEAAAALAELTIAPLLHGYRGRPAADREALIDAMMNLSKLAEVHRETLLEADINPIFLFEEGILAVDAVIRLIDSSAD